MKKFLRKIGPYVFYGFLVVFLFFYLRKIDYAQLTHLEFSGWFVAYAVISGLVARNWGVFIWLNILRDLGAQNLTDKVQLNYAYAKSWLGRYIPGTAPWILGKIYFASRHGISKNKLAVSSVMEGGLQILVTMVVSSTLLIFDRRLDVIDVRIKIAMAIVIILGVVAATPPVFNRLMAIIYRVVRKKTFPVEHQASSRAMIKAALLYVIGVAFYGTSLFFTAKAIYPGLAYNDAFFIIGGASLASAAGMLVIFAPSGIGVRESIQLVMFSLIMPREVALVVVVFSRLMSVLLDFAFFGIAWSLLHGRQNRKKSAEAT